ncbi:DUF6461 domain-containing protein [Actinomadura sp. 7K507]|uniref:DUF6461 domain-containing protein n=1 Tax=Actinomadura sp. 7K507 TaxID=2530365 RepID=UPI001FB84D8F|nr:DUF6461 domain-containing protein [Actinomadura sp. 7K507]
MSEQEWREAHTAAIRGYHVRLRAWAAQNGVALNARGRIPTAVQERYEQATGDDVAEILAEIYSLLPPRVPTAYDWLESPQWQHFLGAASFCLIWVDGLDAPDCLRKLTWLHPVPGGRATFEQVMARPEPPAENITGAARIGEWTLVYLPSGGGSAEATPAVRRLSGDGHQAVAYWQIGAVGMERFLYCRDGELRTEFDPLFPADRQGSQPDLLVPQMTDAGLLPGSDPGDWPRKPALKALALADRITNGAHAGPEVLAGAFLWAAQR